MTLRRNIKNYFFKTIHKRNVFIMTTVNHILKNCDTHNEMKNSIYFGFVKEQKIISFGFIKGIIYSLLQMYDMENPIKLTKALKISQKLTIKYFTHVLKIPKNEVKHLIQDIESIDNAIIDSYFKLGNDVGICHMIDSDTIKLISSDNPTKYSQKAFESYCTVFKDAFHNSNEEKIFV